MDVPPLHHAPREVAAVLALHGDVLGALELAVESVCSACEEEEHIGDVCALRLRSCSLGGFVTLARRGRGHGRSGGGGDCGGGAARAVGWRRKGTLACSMRTRLV